MAMRFGVTVHRFPYSPLARWESAGERVKIVNRYLPRNGVKTHHYDGCVMSFRVTPTRIK
jgi:hypothetical protein